MRPARLSSVEGQAEYAFWHALIRDVAYGQIPRSARAVKHLAVADWIEKMAGARLVDHSELLAHHTTEAIALGQASGASRPGARAPSGALPRPCRRPGPRARRRRSRCTLSQALELLPQGSEEHGLTLLKLADTAQWPGRFEEARAHAEAAASELEAVGAARSAARAYGLLGNVYFQLGEPIACEQPSNARSSSSNRFRRGRSTSRPTGGWSSLEALSGRSPEAWARVGGEGDRLGEQLGLRRELVRAYQWRGLMRCELGDLAGIEDLERALAEAIELRMVLVDFRHT